MESSSVSTTERGRPHVVVVGAGVAGLTAALSLVEAGVRVSLFEKSTRAGGRLSGGPQHVVEWQGARAAFRMEHGVHGVWQRYVNLRHLIERLGRTGLLRDPGEQALIVDRPGRDPMFVEIGAVVRQSRLPSAISTLSILPMRKVMQAPRLFAPRIDRALRPMRQLMAFDPAEDLAAFDDDDVQQFIADFPPVLQQMMRAMTHSGFFAEPDRVSLAAFMTGLWFYGVSEKQACAFHMMAEDGAQALIEPMWDRAVALGADARLGCPVEGIEWTDGAPSAVRIGGGERVALDGLVLAVDPPGMARLGGDAPDAPLTRLLADYRLPEGVRSAIVRLWYGQAPDPSRPYTGIFGAGAADNFFWLHRFMTPYMRWHEATGGGAIECHLYGDRCAEALRSSADETLARAHQSIAKAWPEVGAPISGHVLHNPPTHVAFSPGTMSRLPPVRPGPRGLAFCGDWIACPEPVLYLERACLTGLRAARALGAELGVSPGRLPAIVPQPDVAPSVATLRRLLRASRRRRARPRV